MNTFNYLFSYCLSSNANMMGLHSASLEKHWYCCNFHFPLSNHIWQQTYTGWLMTGMLMGICYFCYWSRQLNSYATQIGGRYRSFWSLPHFAIKPSWTLSFTLWPQEFCPRTVHVLDSVLLWRHKDITLEANPNIMQWPLLFTPC